MLVAGGHEGRRRCTLLPVPLPSCLAPTPAPRLTTRAAGMQRSRARPWHPGTTHPWARPPRPAAARCGKGRAGRRIRRTPRRPHAQRRGARPAARGCLPSRAHTCGSRGGSGVRVCIQWRRVGGWAGGGEAVFAGVQVAPASAGFLPCANPSCQQMQKLAHRASTHPPSAPTHAPLGVAPTKVHPADAGRQGVLQRREEHQFRPRLLQQRQVPAWRKQKFGWATACADMPVAGAWSGGSGQPSSFLLLRRGHPQARVVYSSGSPQASSMHDPPTSRIRTYHHRCPFTQCPTPPLLRQLLPHSLLIVEAERRVPRHRDAHWLLLAPRGGAGGCC